MKGFSSLLPTWKYPKNNIARMKKDALLFIFLLISLPFIMGSSFPESNRGWNSATLEISSSRINKLLEKNKNSNSTYMELYGSELESKKEESNDDISELLDDEYHINRYLGIPKHIGIRMPSETKEKLIKVPCRTIRTDDFEYIFDKATGVPKFTFFQVMKKSFPGSAFNLPEVEKVVFWQHRRYSGEKVFMVEFVLRDNDSFEALEAYMYEKYGDEWKDAYGQSKIISKVDSWKYGDTSIRLVETRTMGKPGSAPVSIFSLAFLDIERTEGVINYLHTLMKLAPDIGMNAQLSIPKATNSDNSCVK